MALPEGSFAEEGLCVVTFGARVGTKVSRERSIIMDENNRKDSRATHVLGCLKYTSPVGKKLIGLTYLVWNTPSKSTRRKFW